MNKLSLKLSNIVAAIVLLSAFISANASGLYPFKPSSLLASGNWVKVRVAESGIYEISYEDLRKMGFSDPSKVGVFGKGGTSLPINFTDGQIPLMNDDLLPVGTWHRNNRLFFYGRFTEEIEFNPSLTRFERISRNIYSLDGAYFLSDSPEALIIKASERPSGSTSSYYLGFDYLYHEDDLFQNTTRTGQIFWGEDLLKSSDKYLWHHNLPLIDNNSKAKLECQVYAADKSSGVLRYGVSQATSGNVSFNVKHPAPASGSKVNPEFMHMKNSVISLSIPGKDVEVYAYVSNAAGDFINLDYWILTYGKVLPDFSVSSEPQERFSIVQKGKNVGQMTVNNAKDIEVFDVTDPANMAVLHKESSGNEAKFFFPSDATHRDFIFCDLSRRQKKITGYEKISNSDLHALASQGADFLILTVPRYKDFAERLADLHRRYDGIEVIVATTEEAYNEFSGGIPDPMAYRALMKCAYEGSGKRMKNMLLVGKVYGDFRRILSGDDAENYIIGFQDNKVTAETEASNAMDFYGCADDYIYSNLQNNDMQVGVGLLPFFSEEDANVYLSKVERYLADTDKASLVNEFMSIGGVGDNHTHDAQGLSLIEYWDQYSPDQQVNNLVAIDAYGEKNAKAKIFSDLRYGKLLSAYCGHGSSLGINSVYDTFRTNDIQHINNTKTGFMIICACDMSLTDHAMRGFGEQLVTHTPNGMIGCVMATRTVWSGQNFELAKLISSSLFTDYNKGNGTGNSSAKVNFYRDTTPTFGEVFAQAKTLSNYSNSLAYLYIGDPAVTIPVPLRRIQAKKVTDGKVSSKQIVKIMGNVAVRDTIHLRDTLPIQNYILDKDASYNGKIVAKLMAPKKVLKSRDFISGAANNTKELLVPYLDERLSEFTAEVKNGEFDFNITIPDNADIFAGESLMLMLSAYDSSKRLASAGYLEIPVGENIASAEKDLSAPAINLFISEEVPILKVTVSDDHSLGAGCLRAEIDGEAASAFLMEADTDSKTLEFAIFTDNLHSGSHSILLSASDAVSNKTEKEFEFETREISAPLTLTPEFKMTADNLNFTIDGAISLGLEIVIEDENNNAVWQAPVKGNSYLWDCKDSSKRRVKAGLYRAKVISGHDAPTSTFSEWVNFAVVN